MADTNFTITGQNFLLKTPFGDYFDTGGLAIVQWEAGYDPKYRPLQEWTSSHLTMVSWTGWYEANHFGVGQSLFGSNGTVISVNSPLYLFIDFGNSSNYTPTMGGQVWMGQITDSLVLDGTPQVIDLNTANIRSVVGDIIGNNLITEDFNSWQPHAIPEPSYAVGALLLFAIVVVHRFKSKKKVAR